MEAYLVTGGAGFIGSNFIRHLTKRYSTKGITIINLDVLTYAGNLKNLKALEGEAGCIFIREDISCQDGVRKVFAKYQPRYVINFAAETHVDRSIKNCTPFIRTNVFGTQVLLDCAREFGAERFLQISTDEVYGPFRETGERSGFTEASPLNPGNPYAASKAAADLLVKSYMNTHGLNAVIARSTNNYGPCQHREKLVPLIITSLLSGSKIPIYGDGRQSRDWLYVEDNCRALEVILEKGEQGEIYNVGSGIRKENLAVVGEIIEALREVLPSQDLRRGFLSRDPVLYVQDRKGHDRSYLLDCTKLSKLGWKPEISFSDGLKETILWYMKEGQCR